MNIKRVTIALAMFSCIPVAALAAGSGTAFAVCNGESHGANKPQVSEVSLAQANAFCAGHQGAGHSCIVTP